MDIKIKTALISVSDKSGLEKIVQALKEHNIKIVSTGGTATAIADMGVDVTDVSAEIVVSGALAKEGEEGGEGEEQEVKEGDEEEHEEEEHGASHS